MAGAGVVGSPPVHPGTILWGPEQGLGPVVGPLSQLGSGLPSHVFAGQRHFLSQFPAASLQQRRCGQ